MIDMGGDDRLYDAAPDGILRINASSRITYANRRACELLGVKPDRLISCSASTIFHSGSIGDKTNAGFRRLDGLQRGQEIQGRVLAIRNPGQGADPSQNILPTYHNREQRAGTLIVFGATTAETARRRLQKLLAAPSTPDALALGVLQAIRSVVPYDLATWGVYTPDMEFYRVLATYPHRDWAIRWWPVRPVWRDWLRTGKTWLADMQTTVESIDPETIADPSFERSRRKA